MDSANCSISKVGYEKFERMIGMIGGKWKLRLLYMLGCRKTLRYGELKRLLNPVTHKMLSTQLKELVADGLIIRKEYSQVPPKVEYSMSEKGLALIPVFVEMAKWIEQYLIQKIE